MGPSPPLKTDELVVVFMAVLPDWLLRLLLLLLFDQKYILLSSVPTLARY